MSVLKNKWVRLSPMTVVGILLMIGSALKNDSSQAVEKPLYEGEK
ncbi:hypothetical protein V2J23_13360 [Geobacillus thermoleovorans]|uniref:Uncharacterized protein n=1 Tax=Geobacillus kaustophilus TaxID=1462 RepID=A0A0D8BWR2_GEOKU|nr:hypothetical protein [Geobacillus kaustophilus]KJE28419.1 hypothetical protein LG52_2153 [Geobacillus kaustophilus]